MNLTRDEAKTEIFNLHDNIIKSARRSVQDAIKIGEIISEQKKLLPHGEFLPWIETLPFDTNTGERYRKLYYNANKIPNVGNLSEAYRQIETIEQQERMTDEQRKRAMISEYRKTGVKPAGWDRSLDYILKKDDEEHEKLQERIKKMKAEQEDREKRAEEYKKEQQADSIFSDALRNATDEYLSKHKEKEEWKAKIKLSQSGEQDKFIDALMEYLEELENDSRRIEACQNIIKVCKNLSVKYQQVKE